MSTTSHDMPDVERAVLDILAAGGMLAADTIARNLNVPSRRVERALETLRRSGDADRNQRGEWQIWANQGRPQRRSAR